MSRRWYLGKFGYPKKANNTKIEKGNHYRTIPKSTEHTPYLDAWLNLISYLITHSKKFKLL